MKSTDLAKNYLHAFFGETPLEEMQKILDDHVEFTGPFYKFNNADDYIESLKETMPADVIDYEILQETENDNTCCIVYKSALDDEICAQLFEVNDNKITRIRFLADASRLLKI